MEEITFYTGTIKQVDEHNAVRVEVQRGENTYLLQIRRDLFQGPDCYTDIAHAILLDAISPLAAQTNAVRFRKQVMQEFPPDGWTIFDWEVQDWYLINGAKVKLGHDECEGI